MIAFDPDRDSGRIRIRLWHDAAVLCEITDPAVIDNPMTGRSAVRIHTRLSVAHPRRVCQDPDVSARTHGRAGGPLP